MHDNVGNTIPNTRHLCSTQSICNMTVDQLAMRTYAQN